MNSVFLLFRVLLQGWLHGHCRTHMLTCVTCTHAIRQEAKLVVKAEKLLSKVESIMAKPKDTGLTELNPDTASSEALASYEKKLVL